MKLPLTKKTIVFMAEDEHILEELRKKSHSLQSEWDMDYVNLADNSIYFLEKAPCDVVVCDFQMQRRKGIEVLRSLQQHNKRIIGIIYAGGENQGSVAQQLEETDLFLHSSCDTTELRDSILKALEKQQLLDRRYVRMIVSEMRSLPVLPELYRILQERLYSPTSSFVEIAEIIAKDVSVTAKILQLVNSAFLGLKYRINNVLHAVAYLGIETLKAVVLTTDIFKVFTQNEIETFYINELYLHSMFVGTFAKRIAQDVIHDEKQIDEIGMAGILHDIGKLVLIRNRAEEYQTVLKKQRENKSPLDMIERSILGFSHAAIGGYLMELWGIPDPIAEAIYYHHTPWSLPGNSIGTMTMVYIANVLVQEQETTLYKDSIYLDHEYVERAGLTSYIPQWQMLCKEIYDKQQGEDKGLLCDG